MTSYVRRSAIALCTGALLVAGTAGPASADHVQQDGLVNVNIGNVTVLQDVNVAAVVNLAANVCIGKVGPIAVLADLTDTTGRTTVICRAQNGAVRLVQS